MALNIKNLEVEQMAAEAARLARESKTEAIRVALKERLAKLKMRRGRTTPEQRIENILARIRTQFPKGDFGKRLSKAAEEKILGIGPDGF